MPLLVAFCFAFFTTAPLAVSFAPFCSQLPFTYTHEDNVWNACRSGPPSVATSNGGHLSPNSHEVFGPPSLLRMARYGPKETVPTNMEGDFFENQEAWEKADADRIVQQRVKFTNLFRQILSTQDPNHLPSIMTRNIDVLLEMRGYEGATLLKDALNDAEASGDEAKVQRVQNAAEYIINFVEEFVEQAKLIDDANKKMLGKIIRAITQGGDSGGGVEKYGERKEDTLGRSEEELLDELLQKEKKNFTPGFLRHMEGECQRIASAPRMTPESGKLLQTMRIIQTRVVEELGKDLGEGAIVLGQLLGYEDRSERLAVLDAGLTVRGVGFAKELCELTKRALDDFKSLPPGMVDSNLIKIVEEIDGRIMSFIARSENSFQ